MQSIFIEGRIVQDFQDRVAVVFDQIHDDLVILVMEIRDSDTLASEDFEGLLE